MKSNGFAVGLALALVAAATLAPLPATAQTPPQQDAAMQAAMKAWMDYGTPGPAHKDLASGVGTWKVATKMYVAPGAPPQESTATSKITSWWDGRYFVEDFDGVMPEGPFHGLSITGYDNLKKKYVTTWMDSMSTGIAVFEGTCDASGKVFTFHGDMPDPPSGKLVKSRTVVTIVDSRTRKFEAFGPGPDGKEFKTMEMLYTRQ
jgi:hypothetical protein